MGYQLLRLGGDTPPTVTTLIRSALEPQLRDVHSMFRLPIAEQQLDAGCNFAIAHTLLALIGGISAVLYEQAGAPGELFKKVLNERYWLIDPPSGASHNEASEILYQEFRNSLTHGLGLSIEYDPKTKSRRVTKTKYRLEIKKYEKLSEEKIELREVAPSRPKISATLTVKGKDAVLLVDGLYWGLRCLVEQLTRDEALMKRVETFLTSTP